MTPRTTALTTPGEGRPSSQPRPGATITITMRDGSTVAASTWDTCLGVGAFVATFLGAPAATHTHTLEEQCSATGSGPGAP